MVTDYRCNSGDFNSGDKSEYDGRNLVKTSIALGNPIIYVAVNYRLGFLGFPSGREAESNTAMNLGILDSRWSLIWLQQFITYFGGDRKKASPPCCVLPTHSYHYIYSLPYVS